MRAKLTAAGLALLVVALVASDLTWASVDARDADNTPIPGHCLWWREYVKVCTVDVDDPWTTAELQPWQVQLYRAQKAERAD
ncbi:MAG: hypothetical protein ABWY78_06150 [Microvirga sp.]